jgi:hypothetical protein
MDVGNLGETPLAAGDAIAYPIGQLQSACSGSHAAIGGLARSTRRAIPVRVVANRIRRQTTLSRHVLAELDRLGMPRLQTVISEAVAYG